MNAKTGFTREMLSANFFREILLGQFPGEPDSFKILDVRESDIDSSSGNSTDMSKGSEKLFGHFPFDIKWSSGQTHGTTRLVIKSKIHGSELVGNMLGHYQKGSELLAQTYDLAQPIVHAKTHVREPSIYAEIQDDRFKRLIPKIYKTWCDRENDIYVIAMERFENVSKLFTVQNLKEWSKEEIEIVLRDIAEIHSIHLGKTDKIEKRPWCDSFRDMNIDAWMTHWECILEYVSREVKDIFSPEQISFIKELLAGHAKHWQAAKDAPATLIHNNFSPRNIYLKQHADGIRSGIYDWDTSWIQVPQRDVCEFLAWFPANDLQQNLGFIEHYRKNLENFSEQKISKTDFYDIYKYACSDYVLTKIFQCAIFHKNFKRYPILKPRVDAHLSFMKMYWK